jgi:hypothetical protein
MPLYDRAAQFSPFAALTGYDEAVSETARLTQQQIELDEDEKQALNEKLTVILEQEAAPEATITYFEPDKRKSGGAYVSLTGRIKKVDEFKRTIMLTDGRQVPIDSVVQIESDSYSYDIYSEME